MSVTPLLSRFTPSLMEPETLEAIFVQREALAQRIVVSIRESVLTQAKHYSLIIGPRGIGKTHFVSLVYHRITAMEDLQDRLAVAWLREEEWGVTSFLDLLLRVLRALRSRGPAVVREPEVEQLYELSPKAAERRAAKLLEEALGGRTLLVIVENLEDVFSGMKAEGQRKLRAHLQEHHSWTILASAQSLFGGVSLQTSPFYGFFRIVHLQQLDLDDAVKLLANIARAEGDEDLAAFISSPHGRARIRAIHHLAGGNPRVYVILSRFLDRTSLDQLVQLFVQAMDDLTPYYQARMQWLSPQQRKIVEYLVDRRGAAPVKEIAQRAFITHQTASGQLKQLRDMGYVQSESMGRESYYELREPLMRFALEMKKQRAEPIRLFVEFLRAWYTGAELRRHLELLEPSRALDRRYLEAALSAESGSSEDPCIAACLQDLEQHTQHQRWPAALLAAEELTILRGDTADWLARVSCLCKLGRPDAAGDVLDGILTSGSDAFLWHRRARLFTEAGQHSAAQLAYLMVLSRPPTEQSWALHGYAALKLGRYEEALAAYERAVELKPADTFSWSGCALALVGLRRLNDALPPAERAVELAPTTIYVLAICGDLLRRLGRYEDARRLAQRMVDCAPGDDTGWWLLGDALKSMGRFDDALAAYEQAARLDPAAAVRDLDRSECLAALGRWDESIAAFDAALRRWGPGEGIPVSYTAGLLLHIFRCGASGPDWGDTAERLVDVHRRNNALLSLGMGLTAMLEGLLAADVPASTVSRWTEMWRSMAPREPGADDPNSSLALPTLLLWAAVHYQLSGDERVLLDLRAEERRIVETMLRDALQQPSTPR